MDRPFQGADARLATSLDDGVVLAHPFIIGEVALGNLKHRETVLTAMAQLPSAIVAREWEVLHFIGLHARPGSGLEYVDAHLLASARPTPDTTLWTRDKRLHGIAVRLGMATRP